MPSADTQTSPVSSLIRKASLLVCVVSFIGAILAVVMGRGAAATGPYVVTLLVAFAVYAGRHPVLKVISFSLWLIAFVAAPLYYPAIFLTWGPVDMKPLVIPLIMVVLFCMGTTLSLNDFKLVFAMPKAVLIGVVLTYTIAPLAGKLVALLFRVHPEIGAGMVLVGASPGGVSSNVMTYLAGGNVALSVTMTAIETLICPVATPAVTMWLAGSYVPIDFMEMVISIVKMVILPIGGGLVMHWALDRLAAVHPVFVRLNDVIMRSLPLFSMAAIVLVCAILTAGARDQLLVGAIVVSVLVAVILQNGLGLFLGYWCARAVGLPERESRTVAIEVGLKNSGMAAGLALTVLKSNLASIPGVVYSSWHNITGALLASYWKSRDAGGRVNCT